MAKVFFDVHKPRNSVGCAWVGAVMSLVGRFSRAPSTSGMDAVVDDTVAGQKHRFCCSQLVVMVDRFIAEQNEMSGARRFPSADASVCQSLLTSHLHASPAFEEIGYLPSGER